LLYDAAVNLRAGCNGHFSLDDDEHLSDLVLAGNGVIANVAEFGYRNTAGHGTTALTERG
jgi:hypothetical protein